jgi:hypothetical protein
MRCGRSPLVVALLLGAMAVSLPVSAQQQTLKKIGVGAPVISVTYNLERGKAAMNGGGFWLQGAGADVALPVYSRFSIAGSLSGAHASNIQPGMDLNKLSYVAGPRFTYEISHFSIFGQGLFGGSHGFESIFPFPGAVKPSANSFAMQLGGGLDIFGENGLGVRAFELDYVRTGLPNNGTDTQNDLRLAFGLSYRFPRR